VAYRFTASGILELSDRSADTVCGILEHNRIKYRRDGNSVRIDHDERATTPAAVKAQDAFEDLAPYVDTPQSIQAWSELTGDYEIGFIDGILKTDEATHVWALGETPPTPEELVDELKRRGIAARVFRIKGRKSGRRSRVFEIQPGSGGPGCRVTIKRRFWDSYDLLSVPEVYQPLCRKYHLTSQALRDSLRNAKFGLEVRKPALGNASSAMIYDALVDVIEDLTEGIRTDIG
jgi:hypothetical protein